MPESMEINSLTKLGNSGYLHSTLLAKSGNYRFPSVKKLPGEKEPDLIIQEFRTLKKENSRDNAIREKKTRILKKGEKFLRFLNKKLAKPFDKILETPFEIKIITVAPFFHVSKQKK